MPRIAVLTTSRLPVPDTETPDVAAALARRGLEPTVLSWDDPVLSTSGFDAALIRTTWDYWDHLDEFVSTLDALPMPLFNPVSLVRWNCHKGYLVELANAGVPVVPTWMVHRGSTVVLPDVGTDEVIVKPAVSAGARGVGRFANGSEEAAAHLADLAATKDVLVQPFVSEVLEGERSLLFFGGTYSHAVAKHPAAGDYRVQVHHGGVNVSHIATDAERQAAQAALSAVDGGDELVYARVDLVGTPEKPLIMELELIEPQLFLAQAPGAADRLAAALAARLELA